MKTEKLKELKYLGNKIKLLRKKNQFTLQNIADAAGCSRAYVSQIERGIVSPSISVLKRISMALRIKLVDLFITTEADENTFVTKRGEGVKIKYPRGDASITLLVKTLDGKDMEPLLKRLNPKTGSDGLYAHSGSQEFGYVISGEFNLMIEDKTYTLTAGDSFYFDSSLSHGFYNNSKEPAEIVWVISPPTY